MQSQRCLGRKNQRLCRCSSAKSSRLIGSHWTKAIWKRSHRLTRSQTKLSKSSSRKMPLTSFNGIECLLHRSNKRHRLQKRSRLKGWALSTKTHSPSEHHLGSIRISDSPSRNSSRQSKQYRIRRFHLTKHLCQQSQGSSRTVRSNKQRASQDKKS